MSEGPIQGKVVGQYFGLFHGCTKEHFATIVDTAPFDCCNLLILGFLTVREQEAGQWGPTFPDNRDNCFNGEHATNGDTDEDRVKLVVRTARAKNPGIKILISLGFYNEVVKASKDPEWFATVLRDLVQAHGFDGFDIDWEELYPFNQGSIGPSDFVNLMQCVKTELAKVVDNPILTICPANIFKHKDALLNKSVMDCFTYVMPQSYDHGGNGTKVATYEQILGSYDKIVYGLSGEGYLSPPSWAPQEKPDDPANFVRDAKSNGAAGIFSWRIDTDSLPKAAEPECDEELCKAGKCPLEGPEQLPTFAVARKMWQLMPGR